MDFYKIERTPQGRVLRVSCLQVTQISSNNKYCQVTDASGAEGSIRLIHSVCYANTSNNKHVYCATHSSVVDELYVEAWKQLGRDTKL